jgi:hypothetical protein
MVAYPFRKLMCCLVTDGGGMFSSSGTVVPGNTA